MIGDKIERIRTYYEGTHGFLIEGDEDEIDLIRCNGCKYGEKCNEIYLCGKGRGFGIGHEPDFFCADGERRTDDA